MARAAALFQGRSKQSITAQPSCADHKDCHNPITPLFPAPVHQKQPMRPTVCQKEKKKPPGRALLTSWSYGLARLRAQALLPNYQPFHAPKVNISTRRTREAASQWRPASRLLGSLLEATNPGSPQPYSHSSTTSIPSSTGSQGHKEKESPCLGLLQPTHSCHQGCTRCPREPQSSVLGAWGSIASSLAGCCCCWCHPARLKGSPGGNFLLGRLAAGGCSRLQGAAGPEAAGTG